VPPPPINTLGFPPQLDPCHHATRKVKKLFLLAVAFLIQEMGTNPLLFPFSPVRTYVVCNRFPDFPPVWSFRKNSAPPNIIIFSRFLFYLGRNANFPLFNVDWSFFQRVLQPSSSSLFPFFLFLFCTHSFCCMVLAIHSSLNSWIYLPPPPPNPDCIPDFRPQHVSTSRVIWHWAFPPSPYYVPMGRPLQRLWGTTASRPLCSGLDA